MQRLPDGSWRYSPTDLVAWLEGDFAAWCERERAEYRGTGSRAAPPREPDEEDEELELARRRGLEHERAQLERLKQEIAGVVEIVAEGEDRFVHTQEAMAAGAPVIFQGGLTAGAWMGIADFLHRLDGESRLGDWCYEPRDTKLARSAKPYFLLQLCAYAELLEARQGVRPERLGVILGDGRIQHFRADDFWHYYRRFKRQFERFQAGWNPDRTPDPAADRSHGRWTEAAERILAARDDLSLVANITHQQTVRLNAAGVETVAQLATLDAMPDGAHLVPATFDKLRQQAAAQVLTRQTGAIHWTLRDPDPERPRRGFALLPPPSPLDVFYDIEGFPYARNGLEYLQGAVTVEAGTLAFHDWWAHDEAAEREAFEAFVDWAWARWQRDPTMHIYHYAAYERSALARLSTKYASREYEVDQFLRHDVLVDLFTVVRQALVIGTPSYSLKEIERLYLPERDGAVTSAAGSVVEYQRWIDSGEPGEWQRSDLLRKIRDYNRVDCESTAQLRDWLLARQREAGQPYLRREDVPEEPVEREKTSAQLLAEELVQRAVALPDGEERRVTQLLAWLLEFHRRDDKPMWWRFFERQTRDEDELYDDPDCLAGVERTEAEPWQEKKSLVYAYRFDPEQETRLHEGSKVHVLGDGIVKTVIQTFDPLEGTLTMKLGVGRTLPDRCQLIPDEHVPAKPIPEAIEHFVRMWAEGTVVSTAVDDLLHRRRPRLDGHGQGPVAPGRADLVDETIAAVRAMDGTTLAIQGPPGTGKTTTAARVIAALLDEGMKVGIVATGHAVIMNLLGKLAKEAPQLAGERLWKVGGDDEHEAIRAGAVQHVGDSKQSASLVARGAIAIGGTAWLFSRAEMRGTLDYLFVDEAGQMSLADVVGAGQSARNIVLVGDQMQLAQPTQGDHPGESGLSCLEYLLEGHQTIPPELGILLDLSYRMQPDVCRFVSEAYYEGRLRSAERTHANRIAWEGGEGAGVMYVPVAHEGNSQASEEEVERVAALVEALLGRQAVIEETSRVLGPDDILMVAPFNAQVRALKRRLGPGARIGTVDKFQGQEAPVVIVSMCASTLDDAPRGAGFLLSPNRLNVAISRAQALAIVVGSPRLGDVRVRSVEEMKLVSGWCRVEERGG